MLLRQNPYVVEHANAATVEMQNRRVRRRDQDMHFRGKKAVDYWTDKVVSKTVESLATINLPTFCDKFKSIVRSA